MGIADSSVEAIASFGIEVIKNHFKAQFDEKKLKACLTDYLDRKQIENTNSSLDEEIDFEGLMQYIKEELLDVVEKRMFDPHRKEREKARKCIIAEAINYSKATTEKGKRRVIKCLDDCINIVRSFIKTGIPKRECLLAAVIVDAVREDVEEITKAQTEEIKEAIMSATSNNSSLVSIERANELMETHQYETLGRDLKNLFGCISFHHPFSPDFGFDYCDGKLISKPLTSRARLDYPSRFKVEGPVRVGDRYFTAEDGDPFDYSYRHQVPMVMEVKKAVKYLGPVEDPLQFEAQDLAGKKLVAHPPAFPDAFPCSIKVGCITYYEYIALRTREILADGTYVLTNTEQESTLYFEVRINPNHPENPDFNMRVNHGSNRDLLKFIQFIDALSKEKDLHIYVLSAEEDLIAGSIDNVGYNESFPSIAEEIDFLERICDIEDYFGVSLAVSGNISQKEYDIVLYLSELVRNESVEHTWESFSFSGEINENTRNSLLQAGEPQMFSAVGSCQFNLFGSTIEFKLYREFCSAVIADFEKMKKKLEVLDNGDTIKVTIHADDSNTTLIESLTIPEHLAVRE